MEKAGEMEGRMQSAAAFVEGGIQDSYDDACSICLESFCENDPSTVTSCRHEFHLHCILEWCQRSSQCPMCWQAISLKDPTSQELLAGVERERNIRVDRSHNAANFRHPTFGDFELQHLPIIANDSELEEHILQHLAAAAMGRSHHIARGEGQRSSSSGHGHQFLVLSTNPNTSSANYFPATSANRGGDESGITGNSVTASNRLAFSNSRSFAGQSSLNNQDSAGPSDFQAFQESLKSRLSAVSMRYKDSITKSTRGWKERFFSRNASMSDIGSEVRREVDAGIATVSRMIQRLDVRDNTSAADASAPQNISGHAVTETSNETVSERPTSTLPSNSNMSASCLATSGPN